MRSRRLASQGSVRACLVLLLTGLAIGAPAEDRHPPLQLFIDAASPDEGESGRALVTLDEWWSDDYACVLVDILRFMQPPRATGAVGSPRWRGSRVPGRDDPSAKVRERLVRFLEKKMRLPAREVFWFAWHAQFPDTELVK